QRNHQRVLQLPLTQSKSPTRSADNVRSLAHRFDSTCEDGLRFTKLDQLGRGNDGLNPRTAEPIDGERRDFHRKTRFQRHMPRPVQGVAAGLKRVPEDRVVEFTNFKSRLSNGGSCSY